MHGELPKIIVAKKGSRARRYVVSALVLLAIGGALYYVYGGSGTQQRRGPGRFAGMEGPVPVLAAQVVASDMPVYLNAVGTTRALNTVTVKAQVDGKLLEVNFKEGQDVKKGDILARIDPVTYQATLDQAIAKKAQDEALLANAKNDLDRYEKLAATNAINKQQADTQRALVAQYTAQVQSDAAAIESAQATLGYTTITAPIDGRTGIRLVDQGNIVHASDSTGIVVITQIRPIAVTYNLPQQDLPQVNAAFAKGPLASDALRSDTNQVLDRGTLTVVDNQVDSSTGTVKLKSEFPNADLQLWPGQFVNVRLLIDTLKQVTVIPTGAVQRGPNGTFVYVVKDDNSAQMRPVQVRMQDENQTVIANGVTPGERVVTTGFARLTDGAKVAVSSGNAAAGAAPATGGALQGVGTRDGQRPAGTQNGERRQRGGGGSRTNAPQ
ncbi:efflux RND transporter periplasmic adaptor subunit [Pseudolabrys taiwanensis]|uniref:Efflux RND transporter periplasmic adaptor subunit n=1 Tax=Pseudolabrys taiwanensis TaxID=331696 RepID=A0A345ZY21_9HYPH|nr:efflux RND transporter periplasmic adaptor subunit [Pseudolabrys taiwanensis]AXK81818.1 efflux RND transporter periplasmic adaptor subunit [Pseudolabrys taiwanensis]